MCLEGGNLECTTFGGSAKIKSAVSPTTAIEGMKCSRSHKRSPKGQNYMDEEAMDADEEAMDAEAMVTQVIDV
jgi:hypothetical protein